MYGTLIAMNKLLLCEKHSLFAVRALSNMITALHPEMAKAPSLCLGLHSGNGDAGTGSGGQHLVEWPQVPA